MQLTFSPALGEQTFLKAAPLASGRSAAPQSILFRATFDSRESFLKAQADGVRVELWSDVPAEGRSRGQWGASQFKTLEPGNAQAEETPTFLPRAAEEEDLPENTLFVHLRVPLGNYIDARFWFTYRLVHPSGEIQWLGEFGRNGELVVEKGLPGVDLREGWNIAEDGTYRTHAFPGERVLGHLTDPEAWVCWSWSPSSLPTFTHVRDGCEGLAMVLSPQSYAREPSVPRPLVFVASHSTTLKITEQGKIILHSSSPFARVSFSVLEHSRDLLKGVAALCNGDVSAFDDDSAVIACRPPDAELPLHLIVLPMSDKLGEHSVMSLRSRDLPKETAEWDGLVLSSADLRSVQIVHGSLARKDHLALLGSSGCELIVAPIHNVPVNGHVAHVALLTPYKDAAVRVDGPVAHTLPTPPPSPPLSDTPTPVGEASQSKTPSPVPPASPRVSQGRRNEAARRRRPSSSALIPYQSPHLIRRYLHMIINVVFWFWSMFVRSLAVRLVGESTTRRISGLIGLALLKTAPPATPKSSPGERLEDRAPTSNKPHVDAVDSGDATSEEKLAETDVSAVAAPAPQYAADVPRDVRVDSPPHGVLSVTLSPQRSEGSIVLLQATDTFKELRATVDGETVSPTPAGAWSDGTRLFAFAGLETGGQLDLVLES
ncbi:uncharacterized protein TRAVEDRAFT_55431 [Trametes versicolor FP-101664 SS1]|uniref:uncharacterized protein n=1 Tax=Trametes versicolor (strain FP-101664) TaxID=717944 RepID=UPI000462232A|nr:uncharacterized protein TRAVEDRAFT_55431 [Trametes versicolor FP-101664 SS1]EIW64522.1 hypothetical protein TRAVEDRAFT_55431 [Trametes versicolor FP-101664 SS1]